MAKYIERHIVDQILKRVNLLELVKEYVPGLKKKGHNWKGISPFNPDEKTPSFNVHPGKGIFKCFSTGHGGNAVKFIELMEPEVGTWLEAMHFLAQKYGIDTESHLTPKEKAIRAEAQAQRESHFKVMQLAQAYYTEQLLGTDPGLQFLQDYLYMRGLDMADVERWGLGLAPKGWEGLLNHLKEKGIEVKQMETLGLVSYSEKKKKHFDRFRNRLMIPIRDRKGQVIAFAGRVIEDKKGENKYINSPATPIYKKSEILYGWDLTQDPIYKAGEAIMVEGYFDVMGPFQHGIHNLTASCGTAVTKEQIQLIKPRAQSVLFIYDDDAPGQKATIKGIDLVLAEGMVPAAVELPGGHDPASYVQKMGGDSFREYCEKNRKDWLDFKLEWLKAQHKIEDPWGKQTIAQELVDTIKLIPQEIVRKEYITLAAKALKIKPKDLQNLADGVREDNGDQGRGLLPKGHLFYDSYLRFIRKLGLNECPDFSRANDGALEIKYLTINNEPAKWKPRGATDKTAIVQVTTQAFEPYGVYIPPAMRRDGWVSEKWDDKEAGDLPCLLVEGPHLAYALSEMGIPALGIANPDSFKSAKAGKKLHDSARKALFGKWRRLAFVLSGKAYQLPSVSAPAGKPLYDDIDAAKIAKVYQWAMADFVRCLQGDQVVPYLFYPNPDSKEVFPKNPYWLEEWLLDHHQGNLYELLAEFIRAAISDEQNPLFAARDGRWTYPSDLEDILRIRDGQQFFDFHGWNRLGETWRLKGAYYQVDPQSNKVQRMTEDDEIISVFERDGRYWAKEKTGARHISDFTLSCVLKVTFGDDTFGLYEIAHYRRPEAKFRAIFEVALFTSRDKFFKRIKGIPGANLSFTGSTQNLIDLDQIMSAQNPPEAENLEGILGWHDEKQFTVWGNGILDTKEQFYEADTDGCLSYDGKAYFLPAYSSIQTRPDHKSFYRVDLDFVYADSDVAYKVWVDKYFKVTGMPGHAALMFLIKSLYRDILVEYTRRDPHLFLLGEKGSGKGVVIDRLVALFGKDLMQLNFNENPTDSAFRDHFSLYSNALAIFNEVNPSSTRLDITGFKGPYDNQNRAKKDARSGYSRTTYGAITSSSVLMGQETTVYQEEAVAERCIFIEFEKISRSAGAAKRLAEMEDLEQCHGLGHILAMFISHRNLIRAHFRPKMERIQGILRKQLSTHPVKVADRIFFNWSQTMAPLFVLLEEANLDYPVTPQKIYAHAVEQIKAHTKNMISKGVLDLFFGEFLQGYYMDRKYGINDNNAWVVTRKDGKKVLNLQFKSTFSRFNDFMRHRYPHIENVSMADMRRRLKDHYAYIENKSMGRLGWERKNMGGGKAILFQGRDGKLKAYQSSCMCFDYELLDIELRMPVFAYEDEPVTQPPQPATANA